MALESVWVWVTVSLSLGKCLILPTVGFLICNGAHESTCCGVERGGQQSSDRRVTLTLIGLRKKLKGRCSLHSRSSQLVAPEETNEIRISKTCRWHSFQGKPGHDQLSQIDLFQLQFALSNPISVLYQEFKTAPGSSSKWLHSWPFFHVWTTFQNV